MMWCKYIYSFQVKKFISALGLFLFIPLSYADSLKLPTIPEAKQAVIKMFGSDIGEELSEVRLGTCVTALNPKHDQQVACTVSLKLGIATNQTQLDFYQENEGWKATVSESQDKLPFPDPKL